MSKITLTIPESIFDDPDSYFLVIINPDGNCEIDGPHALPTGVAEARHLHDSLASIPKQDGRRYMMIGVEEVPEHKPDDVDQAAISVLNKAERTR